MCYDLIIVTYSHSYNKRNEKETNSINTLTVDLDPSSVISDCHFSERLQNNCDSKVILELLQLLLDILWINTRNSWINLPFNLLVLLNKIKNAQLNCAQLNRQMKGPWSIKDNKCSKIISHNNSTKIKALWNLPVNKQKPF